MDVWRERVITAVLVVAALGVWGLRSAASPARAAGQARAARPAASTTSAPTSTTRRPTTTTTAPPTTTTTTRPPTTTTTAPPTTTTTTPPGPFSRFETIVLTQDHGDRYDLHWAGDQIRFDAPASNRDRNLRVLAWDPTGLDARDEEVCATWTGETDDMTQQGLALRVRNDAGRIRAITVTKNIVMATYSNFNVHTWDSSRTGTYPDGRPPILQREGSVHLQGLVQDWMVVKPLPWRLCARAVGLQVQLKAWALAEPEPSWDDPDHAGSVALPAGWDIDGRAGWFAGHLAPGGFAESADLAARALTSAA